MGLVATKSNQFWEYAGKRKKWVSFEIAEVPLYRILGPKRNDLDLKSKCEYFFRVTQPSPFPGGGFSFELDLLF